MTVSPIRHDLPKHPSSERLGAVCLVIGSTLLAAYAILLPLLLPLQTAGMDYPRLVLSPSWPRLALAAFIGVVLLLAGLDDVYSMVRARAGWTGSVGFLLMKAALLLQACVLTWELLLDPIVAAHAESVFLLRDGIILRNPGVTIFRWVSVFTLVAGITLSGVAVYRSQQFSRASLALIAIGALTYAVGPMFSVFLGVGGVIALAVGCLMIGVQVWRAARPVQVAGPAKVQISGLQH